MNNPQVSNENDYKVVVFHNTTDFAFTPEMGCMYNSRPISGISGQPGVAAGEKVTLPYHIGNQLAINLAKETMLRGSNNEPQKDAQGNPMIKSIWDTAQLENLKNSYLTDLYTQERPIAMSETDKLIAQVAELNKMVGTLMNNSKEESKEESTESSESTPTAFQDKAEVIAELKKRGITFDARSNKAALEKLLV